MMMMMMMMMINTSCLISVGWAKIKTVNETEIFSLVSEVLSLEI